jgi:hypothetical protein
MNALSRLLFVALLSLLAIPTASGRIMPYHSFPDRFAESDLVVIARPVTRTADTDERIDFDLVQVDPDGKKTPVLGVGVETKFIVEKVIKGDPAIRSFVLHHYRDASPAKSVLADGSTWVPVGGPALVAFDPTDDRKRRDVLLFLVREADGRYAPFGGQTDPNGQAIYVLEPAP